MEKKGRDCEQTMDLVVSRVFDAPVERVWQAWTDPEVVKHWWAPEGFTTPIVELDLREGGTSLVCMRSPSGDDFCNLFTYHNIESEKRLDFMANFSDIDGNKVDPADWDMPEMPSDIPTEATFEALGDGKTRITYTEHGHCSKEMVQMTETGMNQALDKLATVLAA